MARKKGNVVDLIREPETPCSESTIVPLSNVSLNIQQYQKSNNIKGGFALEEIISKYDSSDFKLKLNEYLLACNDVQEQYLMASIFNRLSGELEKETQKEKKAIKEEEAFGLIFALFKNLVNMGNIGEEAGKQKEYLTVLNGIYEDVQNREIRVKHKDQILRNAIEDTKYLAYNTARVADYIEDELVPKRKLDSDISDKLAGKTSNKPKPHEIDLLDEKINIISNKLKEYQNNLNTDESQQIDFDTLVGYYGMQLKSLGINKGKSGELISDFNKNLLFYMDGLERKELYLSSKLVINMANSIEQEDAYSGKMNSLLKTLNKNMSSMGIIGDKTFKSMGNKINDLKKCFSGKKPIVENQENIVELTIKEKIDKETNKEGANYKEKYLKKLNSIFEAEENSKIPPENLFKVAATAIEEANGLGYYFERIAGNIDQRLKAERKIYQPS